MRRRVQRSVSALVLAGAISLIALNTWFAVSAIQVVQESGYWLAHTWQVISQIERVLVSAKDAESSARGYLLTGDQSYVALSEKAQEELPREMRELSQLISDNPSQQQRTLRLGQLIGDRLALLQAKVSASRRAGHNGDETELVIAGGREQLARLSALAEEMHQEERQLLDARKRAAEHNLRIAHFAVGFASLLDFLLILGIFQRFAKEREMRYRTEEAAEQALVARKEAEESAEQVQRLNIELEERVRQRTAELEATNRELEAFSYSVSHDLRAPLRTIDGFSLALEEDYVEAVDATGRDYIRRVRAGVQRMGSLIDALLQLSRITRAELQREEVSLTAIAETVASSLRDENPGSDLRFKIQPDLSAEADPKLLQVALENLMGNAVKFSSKKPWSEIEVGRSAEKDAWFVRDNGAGFDMHYREKLFNAFNRLHGDKDFKGSGIGLATVARVIRRHHGRIWAASEIDHGATFWFTLG